LDASGTKIANGLLKVIATDSRDNPIPFRIGTTGGQATRQEVTRTITAGSMVGTLQLGDPGTSSPVNILYRFTVEDLTTRKVTIYPKVFIGGSTSFDLASMNTGLSLPQIPYTPVAGPAGPAGANGANGADGAAALASSTPPVATTAGSAGTSTYASRADHQHPIDPVAVTTSASDSYATPPAATSQVLGAVPAVGSGTTNHITSFIDVYHATTFVGIPSSFTVQFDVAEVGRKVEFYILSPDGTGHYTVIWNSGLVAAELLGANSYAVPNRLSIRCPVGCVIGAYTNSATAANRISVLDSGGTAQGNILNGIAQLTLGSAYSNGVGGFTTVTKFSPALAATFSHEAVMVATRWSGQPGGFLALNDRGAAPMANMPLSLGGQAPLAVANGAVEQVVFDPTAGVTKRVIANPTAMVPYSLVSDIGTTVSTGASFQNQVAVSYLSNGADGSGGFAKDGVLTKVRMPPSAALGTSPKVQAWVIRPSVPLSASGVAVGFCSLVAIIGEITKTDSTSWLEFDGLTIPVRAGDLIATRGINTGPVYGSGSGTYALDWQTQLTIADTTVNALNNGATFLAAAAHRRIDIYAEVQPGPYVIKHSQRDANGFVPRGVFRQYDQPWAGKKVIALGTSITAGNPASGAGGGPINAGTGYISQAFQALNCNGVNNGIGSSLITYDGTNNLALSGTIAELNAITAGRGVDSYQTLMTGLGADLVVFDHGYNDRFATIGNLLAVDGVTPNVDRTTFYGAFNYLIIALRSDRPTARFCFLTPISVYTPGTGAGTPPASGWVNTLAIRTSILALAAYWQAPVLDWSFSFELNFAGSQPSTVSGAATNYRGAYASGTTYALNDSVSFTDGNTYISLQASNTGHTPTFISGGGTWWRPAGHTLDGVHPDQTRHDLAAKMLYKFLLTV
jgi:hypothetical protein